MTSARRVPRITSGPPVPVIGETRPRAATSMVTGRPPQKAITVARKPPVSVPPSPSSTVTTTGNDPEVR